MTLRALHLAAPYVFRDLEPWMVMHLLLLRLRLRLHRVAVLLRNRIRQHTSAYVSIRPHTSAYVSIRQHMSAYVSIRQHTSAYRRQMRCWWCCSSINAPLLQRFVILRRPERTAARKWFNHWNGVFCKRVMSEQLDKSLIKDRDLSDRRPLLQGG